MALPPFFLGLFSKLQETDVVIHTKTSPLRLLCAALLTVLAVPAFAQTMYIDDMLLAPLRSGEGLQYRIVNKGLPSGTRIELIETSDSGYSRVRTSEGQEGWLPTRFLTPQPVAKDRLAAATRKMEDAQNQLKETQEELENVRNERDQLASSESDLETRSGKLSQELERIKAVSDNALNLDRRNRELQQSNQELKKEVEVLTAENERLEANKESDFMLLGAALVALGVFIAVVLPWLKPSRKADNWA